MSSFSPLKGDCPICNGAGKRCTQSQTYDITKYTTGLVFCADKTADNGSNAKKLLFQIAIAKLREKFEFQDILQIIKAKII